MTQELKQAILQWDVRSWQPALNYWEQQISWHQIKTACELGARQGGLSLWLALKQIRTLCTDLSHAKQTALPLHNQYPVSAFLNYADVNATAIPFRNEFDLIVFKSILGGIGKNDQYEKQQLVMQQILQALKPGGKLLFAENLAASQMHQQLRKSFVSWGGTWRYLHLREMHKLLEPFSAYSLQTTGFLAVLGRSETQRNLLAMADAVLFNRLCPTEWHYIAYGMAEK